MSSSTEFLLYVTVYRLSVLAIGALSIYLGFRLFNRPVELARSGLGTASAEVESKLFTLRMTDFWPGTYFALFGTVLIGIMLWQGPPELSEKQVVTQPGIGTVSSETLLRQVDCQVHLDSIDQEWQELNKPNITLTEASKPLHQIACYYWRNNRLGEALAMANLAAQYSKEEDRAEHLALLAELLRANGDEEGAAKMTQAAAALRRQGQ